MSSQPDAPHRPGSDTMWDMNTTAERDALDRLLDPVRDCLTPEVAARLVALRADAAIQAKLDDFAARNQADTLSPHERAEYEALVRTGNFIAVLQAKARVVLAGV
jgi:DNA-binding FadR family transcriptional regulator